MPSSTFGDECRRDRERGPARVDPREVSQAYTDWVADGSPWAFARPVRALGDRLRAHGYTVYYEGNLAHLTRAVPEDHCPFSATGWPGTSPYPYCMATDIMPPRPGQVSALTGRPLPSLQELSARLRADRIAGHRAAVWVKYLNHEPEGDNTGPCYHDSWQPGYARRDSTDRGHIHVSARSDMHLSEAADGYDLVARTEGADVPIEGVDYSYARPSPAGLFAAGKRFAVRYGGPGSDAKHLHADELAALRAAGLDVVANAEGASQAGYRGTAAGVDWARQAEADFRALGMPADRPIYFSVDFNAGAADWADIDAALRGSASVIGAARVGVYGGYRTIAHCVAAGTARWFWQTYAWSRWTDPDGVERTHWHPNNDMEQYRNGVTVANGDCDLTRALTADYGQWGFQGGDMAITATDVLTIFGTDNVLPNRPWRGDIATNPKITAGSGIWIAMDEAHAANVNAAAALAQIKLTSAAILTAVQGVNEEAVLAAVRDEGAKALAALQDLEARELERDTANLQQLLTELGDLSGAEPVSVEKLTTALQAVYGRAFSLAAGP